MGAECQTVMVIAGTSDAREIIQKLIGMNISVLATITTAYGKELLASLPNLEVLEGRLTAADMVKLLHNKPICCIIDASHPFAREASENAILASGEAGIPYLRFEREIADPKEDGILRVADFEEAARAVCGLEGKIFLATGSKTLGIFVRNIPDFKERLYVRVLPDSRVIAQCEGLGLNAENIIALKGPFSEGMNLAMLNYTQASVLVTKDSGEAGGTLEKLNAAKKLGVRVILIERPQIPYPAKVDRVDEVVEYVNKLVRKNVK